MPFDLEEVVPWGRSFEEYQEMFALDDGDLAKRCLGCGDGPASFNSTHTSSKGSVISVDPIYRFTAEEIAGRLAETFEVVMKETRQHADEFVWTRIGSIEELGLLRMEAMADFLLDFPKGRREGRYVDAQLPLLPFADQSFDLALCSHLLFLYSRHLDQEFHLQSLRELCRVAREVRVFPILELGSVRSRHVDQVVAKLTAEGYQVRIERVTYEFQKGGNEMLRIRKGSS